MEQGKRKMKPTRMQAVTMALIIAITFLRNQIWLLASPLMSIIMKDLSITYTQAGMLLSIITMLMGVSMFVGSYVIDRWGASITLAASSFFLVADGLIAFCGGQYAMILVGRMMSGIGYGLSACAIGSLVAARFSAKQRGFANGFNTAVNSLSNMAAFIIAVPLFNLIGSWRGSLALWSLLSGLLAVVICIIERGGNEITKTNKKEKSSLRIVAQMPEIWHLSVAMIGALFVFNCFTTYLPTYLTEYHAFSFEHAGTATSLLSIAGILGCIASGFLTGFFRKVKVSMLIFLGSMMCGAVSIVLVTSNIYLYISIFIFGFSFYGWTPMAMTQIMNVREMQPKCMGAALAIYSGTGGILAIFIPVLFGTLQTNFGMKHALLVFCILLIPSMLAILHMKAEAANGEKTET